MSGERARRLRCRLFLAARECQRSEGSPSLKLASAQRGWGLPRPQVDQEMEQNVKQATVPRSSLTRLSNSAILLRRRVASSSDGSSLETLNQSGMAREGEGWTYRSAGSSISYTQRPVYGHGEMEGRESKVNTHETKLDAALAGPLSVALGQGEDRRGGARGDGPFALRCGS